MTARAMGVTPPLSRGLATLAVVASSFGFASISSAVVLATRAGTPLTVLVAGRFLLAALLIAVLVGGSRRLTIGRARALPLVWQGGVGQACINLLALSALAYIPAAEAVFLFYSYPAWIAIFAVARGSERIGGRRALALALSLAGIAMMVGLPRASSMHPAGVALALAGAMVYAVYVPLLRHLQADIDPLVATFYIAVGVAAILLVTGAVRGELAWRLPRVSVAVVAWLAIVSTVVGFSLFMRGLATLGPVHTSIVATVEPFFAAVLAAVVLGQPITLPTMIGGTFIAVAVLLLQRAPA